MPANTLTLMVFYLHIGIGGTVNWVAWADPVSRSPAHGHGCVVQRKTGVWVPADT